MLGPIESTGCDMELEVTGLAAPTPSYGLLPAGKLRCLIVEDQVLIAMSLEAYLEDVGYELAGPFRSNAEALAWLEDSTPDLAILDYKLNDGLCVDLARILKGRGVPFVIYSGDRQASVMPPEFEDAPWIEKPCPRQTFLDILTTLVPGKAVEA
jgi:DNA-binding response OmpR family regulator